MYVSMTAIQADVLVSNKVNIPGGKIKIKTFNYMGTSVFLENTPLVKFIRNHIRDSGGVFSISLLMRISMISLISSLSLKLYLNSSVYDRNIFGSSPKVCGNLRKFSKNVRKRSCDLRTSFGEFSGIFGSGRKSSGNRQKRRHQHVYIIKRTLHVSLKAKTISRLFAPCTREI